MKVNVALNYTNKLNFGYNVKFSLCLLFKPCIHSLSLTVLSLLRGSFVSIFVFCKSEGLVQGRRTRIERVGFKSQQQSSTVSERGGEGNTISLLMEEKFLQIGPVKYMQLPRHLIRRRLGQSGGA